MIGCGSFARQCHGPAQAKYYALHPDVELAACCDVDPDRSREYAEAFGFKRCYADIEEILSTEKPGAVVLAVPPAVACGPACRVLKRGFPLLLEKPPGMSPAELGQLIAAAREGGARVQVAFNRRYMPVMRRARDILASAFRPESVDRIDYAMFRFDRWDPDFSTTAVHGLDAAIFLARSPFRFAELRFQPQKKGDREAANIAVEAECACGSRVLVDIRPVSEANVESASINAAGQSLVLRIPVSPQSPGDGCVEHWRDGTLAASFSDRGADAVDKLGIFGETEAFLNAVRSGGPVSPGLQDCHQQVALMEAIRARRSGPIQFGSP